MDRKTEIRALMQLSPAQVVEKAGERLVLCDDLAALHKTFAEHIAQQIRAAQGRPLNLIVPVGPTGQYPILAGIIQRERLSLENCRLFFMDEYCDASGAAVASDHPLSLRGAAHRVFLDRLDASCGLRPENVIFPSEDNIADLEHKIEETGGIDVCYGGVGIHGHVAFNEPGSGVRDSGPRKVDLNDFTVTINAVRAKVGGNLECFPRQALTLGMRQILGARKIHLYCRNGCELDWANTVLRLALFGSPGDDYPVTHIRDRDYVITTDRETLASPENTI